MDILSPAHLRDVLKEIGPHKKEEQHHMIAELGRRCLFFLVTEILGYKDVDVNLHWSMAEEWQKPARNKLFLCPRGTLVTFKASAS